MRQRGKNGKEEGEKRETEVRKKEVRREKEEAVIKLKQKKNE